MTRARRAISQSSSAASAKRMPLNDSGGSCVMASLLALKLPPQIRATNTISAS